MSQGKRAPDPWPLFERTGTPGDLNALNSDIAGTADRLIEALETLESAAGAKARVGIAAEDIRFLAYALAVHHTRRGAVLTEDHLRLLHAALGIKRHSLGANQEVGLPVVKDLGAFHKAADLEADNSTISIAALAKGAGVDRTTIRAWQVMKAYQDRVRFVRQITKS